MPLTRLTAIDGDSIIPLADAKAHLRVTHTNDETLIAQMRDAAIGQVERISGVALAEAEFRWSMRSFPCRVDLPMGPVTTLDAVAYHNSDGVEQAYDDARLIEGSAYPAVNGSWPSANGYAAVEFTAGLASPEDAPELIAAAKLILGHLYANREAVSVGDLTSEIPLAAQYLIDTYRAILV